MMGRQVDFLSTIDHLIHKKSDEAYHVGKCQLSLVHHMIISLEVKLTEVQLRACYFFKNITNPEFFPW